MTYVHEFANDIKGSLKRVEKYVDNEAQKKQLNKDIKEVDRLVKAYERNLITTYEVMKSLIKYIY